MLNNCHILKLKKLMKNYFYNKILYSRTLRFDFVYNIRPIQKIINA